MRARIRGIAFCITALCAVAAHGGTDLNEVGALLVYPAVIAVQDGGQQGAQETFITLTNTGPDLVWAHVALINGREFLANGDENPEYCFECDFNIALTPSDTETLVLTDQIGGGISIVSLDGTLSLSCDFPFGMLVVSLETANGGPSSIGLTDNVLLGEQVVVDYGSGYAFSIPAIPFQGKGLTPGDRKRRYRFDDAQFSRFPRVIATDFIAPDLAPGLSAELALFTLHFDREHPPETDCSVTGFDAFENPFSNSFQFGCWSFVNLLDVQTEFAYPNLGQFGQLDEHGWLQLSCRVDRADDGLYEVNGGVHGAIVQRGATGAAIRRNNPAGPGVPNAVAWARLLYQSVTAGDATTLQLESLFAPRN